MMCGRRIKSLVIILVRMISPEWIGDASPAAPRFSTTLNPSLSTSYLGLPRPGEYEGGRSFLDMACRSEDEDFR